MIAHRRIHRLRKHRLLGTMHSTSKHRRWIALPVTESMTVMIAQALNLEPRISAAVIPQALPFAIINGATAPIGAVGREYRAVHPSNGFVIINGGRTQGTISTQATTGTLISTDEGTSNTFQTSVFVPSIREVTADTNPILTRIEFTYKGYYDPSLRRFISSDALMSTGQDLLGFNMYAYCLNNPVNMSDPDGMCSVSKSCAWSCHNCSECAKEAALAPYTPEMSPRVTPTPTAPISTPGPAPAPAPAPDFIIGGGLKQTLNDFYGMSDAEVDAIARNKNDPRRGKAVTEQKNRKRRNKGKQRGQPVKSVWNPVLGVGLAAICVVAIIAVVADDVTGVGVVDDFLLAPLGAGVAKGIAMAFGG